MLLRLGTTNDAYNVVGKNIEWGDAVALTARVDLNALNPTITLDNYAVPIGTNYAELLDINNETRRYFIRSVTRLTGSRTELALAVDVLETHKETIKALTVVADRASAHINRYVADGQQLTESRPQVVYRVFNGQPFNSSALSGNNRCIVVRGAIKGVG